jgi:glycosyltransferase involved in cell wall biosynthesis
MSNTIGVDISRSVGNPTGVGWYALQLVRGLAETDAENRYILYPLFWHCHPPDYKGVFRPTSSNFQVWDINRDFEELQKRWSDSGPSPREVLGPIELLHSTAYTAPYVPGITLVVTIHDLSFLTHPHFHTEANRRFCTVQTLRAARFAHAIICVSQSTADDLRRYLHVPKDRVFIIPEAAGPEYRRVEDSERIATTLARLGIQENFILFVGTVEPRKNLAALIEAFAGIKKDHSRSVWLVVAGGSGWLNEQIYRRVEELDLTESVRFLGYVSTDELVVLYSACRAFVYPSLCEGFGLPVLEAMACGAPVITSKISSLPEVAGDAALTVDPESPEAIVAAMNLVLDDRFLRNELRQKGVERSNLFSWHKTARQTREVYARCLQ